MTKLRTHYDNLKVARDAPDAVIRAAYKVLVQKYHPDKNPGDPRATRVMSLINQSYEVLSDPEQRREHDAWIARDEAKFKTQAQPQSPPIPPQWQQPEPEITQPKARGALATLLLLPVKLVVGLFEFSPRLAMLGLLFGGLWLWNAVTPDRPPPPGPKPYQATAPSVNFPGEARSCQKISHSPSVYRCETNDGTTKYVVRNRSLSGTAASTRPNTTPLADGDCHAIPYHYTSNGKLTDGMMYSYVENGERNYSSTKPAACEDGANQSVNVGKLGSGKYVRPSVAPNGNQWPTRAAYVKGYPIDNRDGRSEVTVDNTQNNADVFVKLVSLADETAYPIRQFYIPAGSKFTMNKVRAGQYDLRYLDLLTGKISRSESFDVTEERSEKGVRYSEMTMTLYKVQDGNFHTYDLAEGEF